MFNPNATGPGSHFYTKSLDEAQWLVAVGWKDEEIAFIIPNKFHHSNHH